MSAQSIYRIPKLIFIINPQKCKLSDQDLTSYTTLATISAEAEKSVSKATFKNHVLSAVCTVQKFLIRHILESLIVCINKFYVFCSSRDVLFFFGILDRIR